MAKKSIVHKNVINDKEQFADILIQLFNYRNVLYTSYAKVLCISMPTLLRILNGDLRFFSPHALLDYCQRIYHNLDVHDLLQEKLYVDYDHCVDHNDAIEKIHKQKPFKQLRFKKTDMDLSKKSVK